jgi:hypothetical protein
MGVKMEKILINMKIDNYFLVNRKKLIFFSIILLIFLCITACYPETYPDILNWKEFSMEQDGKIVTVC